MPSGAKDKSMATAGSIGSLNCGPIKFAGNGNALYERHLIFDQIVPPAEK